MEESSNNRLKEELADVIVALNDIIHSTFEDVCDKCLGTGEIVYGSDTEIGREVIKCDKCNGEGIIKSDAKTV